MRQKKEETITKNKIKKRDSYIISRTNGTIKYSTKTKM